jgi:hypothetical protein
VPEFDEFAARKTEFFRDQLNKILSNETRQFATLDSLVWYMVAEGARWRHEKTKEETGQ